MQEAPAVAPIVVVDDSAAPRRALVRVLRRRGMAAVDFEGPSEALREMEAGLTPRVVISDYMMPDMNGVDFLSEVRHRWPQVRRVLITGFSDPEALQRAINDAQVHRFVARPWSTEALVQVVEECVQDYDVLERLSVLTTDLEAQVEERTRLLHRAKDEWLRTVDAIEDPLTLISPDFRIQRTNKVLAERAGVSIRRVRGRRCWETVVAADGPCPGCPVPRCLDSGERSEGEVKDPSTGAVFRVSAYPVPGDDGSVESVVCSYRDVTDERDLQARLIQSEKMAAIGTLAGGVAHEINNPMGGILAFAQLLLRDEKLDEDARSYVAEIEESAQRCRKIVQGLLNFSRSSSSDLRGPVDVNEVAEKALFLVEHTVAKHGAAIRRELSDGVRAIHGNANQIQQVIVNLVTNACGAVGGRGEVAIRTGEAAGSVWIEVRDEGVGIPVQDRDKVFMPFFTTKPTGEGTGLGLAVSLGIIEAHGGTIDFDSEEGRGTTFRVSLPSRRPREAAA